MTTQSDAQFTARAYRDTTDLARILQLFSELRQSMPSGIAPHPGMLLWHVFQMHGDFEPAKLLHLWETSDGSLVGYVLLYRNFAGFDWQVLPSLRGAAIEQTMLTWATSELQCAGCAFVHEQDAQRLALLTNLGYRPGDGWVSWRVIWRNPSHRQPFRAVSQFAAS
jgi:hypothetical protein